MYKEYIGETGLWNIRNNWGMGEKNLESREKGNNSVESNNRNIGLSV